MSDIYLTSDIIIGLILSFLVVMLIPVMIWTLWMAKKKKPAPPLPQNNPIYKMSLGAILMEYPNLKEIMVVTRELELRIHRMSREAKLVADEQKYITALSVLKEITPECTEDGMREFHERLKVVA